MAGRWNSIKTAEGYGANRLDQEHSAMQLLNGRHAATVKKVEGPGGLMGDEGCRLMVSSWLKNILNA